MVSIIDIMSLEKKQKKVRAKGKRGRKPTSKILSLKTNNKKKTDNLIAHIPLDEETIKKYINDENDELLNKKNKIDIFFESNNTYNALTRDKPFNGLEGKTLSNFIP